MFFYIASQHPFVDGNKSTAYLYALTLIDANLRLKSQNYSNLEISTSHYIAPPEAEEITCLAEAGKDDKEIRLLIKRFLHKHIEQ